MAPGERALSHTRSYVLTNYRLIQWDEGTRCNVSLPLHIIKEYKLTPTSAMFKVVNGIVNVVGSLVPREQMRAALGLKEYATLTAGDQRRLCEMSGMPFVHENQPYNRWSWLGFHRPFSRHFYTTFAWIRGEAVFTYWPDSFILTNYRLYQFDSKKRKVFLFPINMIETFESRRDKLKIKATTGDFEMRGTVPRQDHLVRIWQQRDWDQLPSENLDWLLKSFDQVNAEHPLDQYTIADSVTPQPMFEATETRQDAQTKASTSAGSGVVFVKPQIKSACTNCNAPMSYETIDWVGPDQYKCEACGAVHNVDYVRML
jgi:hypothetical protein